MFRSTIEIMDEAVLTIDCSTHLNILRCSRPDANSDSFESQMVSSSPSGSRTTEISRRYRRQLSQLCTMKDELFT